MSAISVTSPLLDTFLQLDGWHKGVAFINGFNLGRYWPIVGPQKTLYVPGTILLPHPAKNRVIVFEQEKTPCFHRSHGLNQLDHRRCQVKFVTVHDIDGPTPLH